jgi:hypothetical protein
MVDFKQRLTRRKGTGGNRVDGLIGFFTDEVRLSHHVAYGSRTTRFVKHTAIALYTDHSFVLLWDKASHTKVKPPYRISNNLTFSPSLDREASVVLTARSSNYYGLC